MANEYVVNGSEEVIGNDIVASNATVAGTLGVTGATTAAAITASGLITANGGILVPDGNITIAEGGTGASTVPSALSNLGFLSNNPIVGTSIAIPGTILSTLTVGSNPRIIAIDSAGNQYVTNYGSGTISIIAGNNGVLLPLLNQMQSYSEIQALNIATLDISNSGINNLSDYSNTSLNFSLSTNYNIQALSLIR